MVCALWTIHEGLEKGQENLEIRGQGETSQTTALLRSAKYWEVFWRLVETCSHSNFSEKLSASIGVKNSQISKIITTTTIIIIMIKFSL